MNVVVTMAGRGQRFLAEGYATPKPLIDVGGEPMYSRVAQCLPLEMATNLVFVCQAEHLESYGLRTDIEQRFAEWLPQVVALDRVLPGQACTVREVATVLDDSRPLLVHNSDTLFNGSLPETLARYPNSAGVLGVAVLEGTHWSFARTDPGDPTRVVETAEKRRISNWASTGLYYFGSVPQYCALVDAALEDGLPPGSELYIAPLYNRLIEDGGEVRIDVATSMTSLGTPAELHAYLAKD